MWIIYSFTLSHSRPLLTVTSDKNRHDHLIFQIKFNQSINTFYTIQCNT